MQEGGGGKKYPVRNMTAPCKSKKRERDDIFLKKGKRKCKIGKKSKCKRAENMERVDVE